MPKTTTIPGLPAPTAQLPLTLFITRQPGPGESIEELVRAALLAKGVNCQFSVPRHYDANGDGHLTGDIWLYRHIPYEGIETPEDDY